MILQALAAYYDILAEAGKITPRGFSRAKVSIALHLREDGALLAAVPLKIAVERGKKTVEIPQLMDVPAQEKRSSGIKANFLCDNGAYLLGSDKSGKPERTAKCFAAAKALHHTLLDGVDAPAARGVLAFLDHWQPEAAADMPALADVYEDILAGANLVFRVGDVYAHEDAEIRRCWLSSGKADGKDVVMQCLVTGEQAPVARLHPSIKGVKDAQSSGASLVSFNVPADDSYGRDKAQGLNAPVSRDAAFAYGTALNYLLQDKVNMQQVGGTAVVYWAMNPNSVYRDLFSFALCLEEPLGVEETEDHLKKLFQKLVAGLPMEDFSGEVDKDVRFYILGLAPNAARLAVRFFHTDSYGNILANLRRHYLDLEIEKAPFDPEQLSLRKLLLETVSPKTKEAVASPLLAGAVLRAICMGQSYPALLYQSVIVRIRAERQVPYAKAAIIKAYLLRSSHYKEYKEELKVSLSEESKNKAYILGRLFAVLEKAQLDANPGINTTIKDRYFTSACATPANAFPVILRLHQHHIAKIKRDKEKAGFAYANERRVQDLMDKLEVGPETYPRHLSLADQGIFILGYYHQQKAFYTKNTKDSKEEKQ